MKLFAVMSIFLLTVVTEGTFVTVPIVLGFLIVLQIRYASEWILLCAFFAGLILDSMLFRNLGATSLYLLSFLLLVSLYERRFEVKTVPFVLASVIVGTSGYLFVFGTRAFFWQIGITVFLSILLFFSLADRSIASRFTK
ncbi:MAG: hypothetical protein Q8Q49_04595 [bacterium]|nr:hypothetical protein [bacterium]